MRYDGRGAACAACGRHYMRYDGCGAACAACGRHFMRYDGRGALIRARRSSAAGDGVRGPAVLE
jgi:hypothetical protein